MGICVGNAGLHVIHYFAASIVAHCGRAPLLDAEYFGVEVGLQRIGHRDDGFEVGPAHMQRFQDVLA